MADGDEEASRRFMEQVASGTIEAAASVGQQGHIIRTPTNPRSEIRANIAPRGGYAEMHDGEENAERDRWTVEETNEPPIVDVRAVSVMERTFDDLEQYKAPELIRTEKGFPSAEKLVQSSSSEPVAAPRKKKSLFAQRKAAMKSSASASSSAAAAPPQGSPIANNSTEAGRIIASMSKQERAEYLRDARELIGNDTIKRYLSTAGSKSARDRFREANIGYEPEKDMPAVMEKSRSGGLTAAVKVQQPPESTSVAASVGTTDHSAMPVPDVVADLQRRYPNLGPLEVDKVQWMLNLDEEEKARKTKMNDVEHPETVRCEWRFDFQGKIVGDNDTDPYSGLHHHGDEPEKGGYTVTELLMLMRSSYQRQQVLAFDVMARVLRNGLNEGFDRRIETLLLEESGASQRNKEPGPLFTIPQLKTMCLVLRIGIDSSTQSTQEAALNTLNALLYNAVDVECVQEFAMQVYRGDEMVEMCPLVGPQNELSEGEDGGDEADDEHAEMKDRKRLERDLNLCGVDLLAGFFAMDLAKRVEFVLYQAFLRFQRLDERKQSHQMDHERKVIGQCIEIMTAVASHSGALGHNMFQQCQRLASICEGILAWHRDHSVTAHLVHTVFRFMHVTCASTPIGGKSLLKCAGATLGSYLMKAASSLDLLSRNDPCERASIFKAATHVVSIWRAATYAELLDIDDVMDTYFSSLMSPLRNLTASSPQEHLELASASLSLFTAVVERGNAAQWKKIAVVFDFAVSILRQLKDVVLGYNGMADSITHAVDQGQRISPFLLLLGNSMHLLGAYYQNIRSLESLKDVPRYLLRVEDLTQTLFAEVISSQAMKHRDEFRSLVDSLRAIVVVPQNASTIYFPQAPSLFTNKISEKGSLTSQSVPILQLLTYTSHYDSSVWHLWSGLRDCHPEYDVLASEILTPSVSLIKSLIAFNLRQTILQIMPGLVGRTGAYLFRTDSVMQHWILNGISRLVGKSVHKTDGDSAVFALALSLMTRILPNDEILAREILSKMLFAAPLATDLALCADQNALHEITEILGTEDEQALMASMRSQLLPTFVSSVERGSKFEQRIEDAGRTLICRSTGSVVPFDWLFMPLAAWSTGASKEGTVLQSSCTDKQVINFIAYHILLRETYPDFYLAAYNPGLWYVRLTLIMLLDANIFLDPGVLNLMGKNLEYLVSVNSRSWSLHEMAVESLDFGPVYEQALTRFATESYGNEVWACWLMFALRVHGGSVTLRRGFWAHPEEAPATIRVSEEELTSTAFQKNPSLAARFIDWLFKDPDAETDGVVLLNMLQLVRTGTIGRGQHKFVHDLACFHLGRAVTQLLKAADADITANEGPKTQEIRPLADVLRGIVAFPQPSLALCLSQIPAKLRKDRLPQVSLMVFGQHGEERWMQRLQTAVAE
eukprot:Clim_evm12s227 gene=Clim_evmTU12s227